MIERGAIFHIESDDRSRENLRWPRVGKLLLEFLAPVLSCHDAAVLMRGDAFIESREMPERDVTGIGQRASRVPENRELFGVLSDDNRNDGAFNHDGKRAERRASARDGQVRQRRRENHIQTRSVSSRSFPSPKRVSALDQRVGFLVDVGHVQR